MFIFTSNFIPLFNWAPISNWNNFQLTFETTISGDDLAVVHENVRPEAAVAIGDEGRDRLRGQRSIKAEAGAGVLLEADGTTAKGRRSRKVLPNENESRGWNFNFKF